MLQNHLSTSSSSKASPGRELLAFLRSLVLLVLLPAALLAGFILILGWRIGATLSPVQIAAMQHDNPKLLWAADGQYYGPLKTTRITQEQPEVIAVGDSRCSQIRSAMFKPYSFHNGCLTAWTFSQIRNILDMATRQAHPRVMIFTLDYFMFSDKYVENWAEKAGMDYGWTDRNFLNGLISTGGTFKAYPWTMIKQMPAYLFGRKIDEIDSYELLGLTAIRARAGFRQDGSMLYDPVTRANSTNNNNDLSHILAQVPVGSGARMSARQIDELRSLAELAKERGVTLVGLQLPIIKEAVDVLDAGKPYNQWAGPDAAIWKAFMSDDTRALFRKLGIHFFDMTHNSATSDRIAFIDPAHPGERVVLGALVSIVDDPDFRSVFPKIDAESLRQAYAEAQAKGETFDVFHTRF